MDSSRKLVQRGRLLCLVGIVFLALVTTTLAPTATANPTILGVLTFLAVGDVGVVYFARRILIARSEKTLGTVPDDPKSLARWRSGYIVIYAVSGAIAIYGVVLHILGFAFSQVASFFVAGIALTLFFGPRRPAESR